MEPIKEVLSQIDFDHQHWINDLNYLSNEMDVYKRKLAGMLEPNDNEESEELLHLLDELFQQKKIVLNLMIKVNNHIFDMVRMRSGNGHFEKFIDHDHIYTGVELSKVKGNYATLKDKISRISKH